MAPSMAAQLAVTEELRQTTLTLSKRSMVLDEEKFEAQFLRCQSCQGLFHAGNMPRLLPCHHSFCQPCLDVMYDHALEVRGSLPASYSSRLHAHISGLSPGSVSLTCPTCHSVVIVNDNNIKRLPTDHRVVQLIDFAKNQERYTVTFCSRHSQQPLNFFCEPCVKPVCRDCTVLDHTEADGHLVLDLDEALGKYTPMLDTAVSDMTSEIDGIEQKCQTLASVTKTIEGVKGQLVDQVKSCMARLRELVDEREKELIDKVHHEVNTERSKLIAKSDKLVGRREFLTEQSRRLREAKKDNDVQEMFQVNQEVKDFKSNIPARIREVDDGLMTSFMLNTREETVLGTRIKNFADVSTKVETTSSIPRNGTSTYSAPSVYRSSSTR